MMNNLWNNGISKSLFLSLFIIFLNCKLFPQEAINPALDKRIPKSTVFESGLDFTKVKDFTGNVSLPVPLVSLGSAQIQLKYYNQGIPNLARTENQYAPSGSVGLGWQLLHGSISAEINNNSDTTDDRYFFNAPDGSFQLQEGADGTFRIPNYKPWKIQRIMNGRILAGWIITKEDGTIFRFGNYYRINGSYKFSLTIDSTYATRFLLGIDGLVSNPDPLLYSTLSLIPYQWDLSDIQEVNGRHTTINYKQVKLPLITGSSTSADYGMYYTRESHPFQLLDNKGMEIRFTYAAMEANTYYNSYSTYRQNLLDTLSLSSIEFRQNSQLYKKIEFQYQTSDIFSLGILKRYLKSYTIKDQNNNALPSSKFQYFGLDGIPAAASNGGMLRSVVDPLGGSVTFNYKEQQLPDVSLSKANNVNAINYWNNAFMYPGTLVPNDDGLTGKGFTVVRSNDNSLKVYRSGPKGWYTDTSFPLPNSVNIIKVSNDYIVLNDSINKSYNAVRLTSAGWKSYNVGAAIQQSGDTLGVGFQVIGTGLNYFVAKHNCKISGKSPYYTYYKFDVSVIRFTPGGLKVDYLGKYWDGYGPNAGNTGQELISMRAFCGENYLVIESGYSGGNTSVYSHFKYSGSTGTWQNILSNTDAQLGQYPNVGSINMGKNFIVCNLSYGGAYHKIKVYNYSGSPVDSIDYTIARNNPSIITGDDFYAYSGDRQGGQAGSTAYLRTWNPVTKSFNTTDFSSLYSGLYGDYFNLISLGNRVVVNWLSYQNGKSSMTAYTTYSPISRNWSAAQVIENTQEVSWADCISYAVGISGNAFVKMKYYQNYNSSQNAPPPTIIKSFEFQGQAVKSANIASFACRNSATYSYEQPQYWILQPGNDFLALSRPGIASAGYSTTNPYAPDSVNIFTFIHNSSGVLQFSGTPTLTVLSQRILKSGMGDSATYNYSYNNGVLNEFLTTEYRNVTENQPNNYGKTVTSYYTCIDSVVNGLNYKNLDGMSYKSIDYNNSETVINETNNSWKAVGVDSLNGVFTTELLSSTVKLDNVSKVTSYTYKGAPYYENNSIIETNSDGAVRKTNLKYPQDYSYINNATDPFVQAIDSMQTTWHICNPVIEKTVTNLSGSVVYSGEIYGFRIFNRSQMLPFATWKLRNLAGDSLSNFSPSATAQNIFTKDSRYIPVDSMQSYDSYGNILQNKDANGTYSNFKYGYNNRSLIAKTLNAQSGESGSAGFENGREGWEKSGTGDTILTSNAHTGIYSVSCSNTYGPTKNFYVQNGINKNKAYLFTAWVNISSGTATMTIEKRDGSNNVIAPNITTTMTSGTGSWQQMSLQINQSDLAALPSNGYLRIWCGFIGSGNSGFVDDIRFYPVGAGMTTMTYDPVTLNTTSISDESNNPSYYIYDSFDRLSIQKDALGRIVKRNYYFYSDSANTIGSFRPNKPNFIRESSFRTSTDSTTIWTFLNGLSRKIETQVTSGSGQNIVSYTNYDLLGRPSVIFKPFMYSTGNAYDIDNNGSINSQATSYYNTNVYVGISDNYPYSTNTYFNDPIGRLQKTIPSGSLWQTHPIQFSYGYNTSSSEVAGYNANTLSKVTTTDENGVKHIEYKDKFGFQVAAVIDSGGLALVTKLKYNILGKLIKSNPPKGDSCSTTYSYNTLGQLTKKTSPDAGTAQYIYDKNGNLRLVKDANHGSTLLNNVNISQSIGTNGTYNDSLTVNGRGKVTVTINPGSNSFSSGTVTVQIKKNNAVIYTLSATTSNLHPSGTVSLPTGRYGYTVQSTARTPQGYTSINYTIQCLKNYVFVYNKYDQLNRLTETGEYETDSLSTSFSQANAENPNYPSTNNLVLKQYIYDVASTNSIASGQKNLKGRLSYSVANSPGSANNVYENNTTFYSYDEMGRIEWTIQLDMGWYQKKLSYTYDLQGNLVKKGYYDYDWRSGPFYTSYAYDQAGRLTTVNTSPDSNMSGATKEATYQYFASGKQKRLQLAQAQGIDYRYNERDWLTMINHQNLTSAQDPGGDGANGVPADKFGMILGYNRITDIGLAQNAAAQWNGNISWIMYQMSGVNYTGTGGTSALVGYNYSYDKANRILGSDFGYYYNGWLASYAYDEKNYKYDANGNIVNLQRYNKNAGLMDNLTYYYSPGKNQLNYVADVIPDSSYTSDLDNQLTGNYTYDCNGNSLSDIKNGIGFIQYNIDNIPIYIYKTDGSYVFNAYDVSGTRVRKLLSSGTDNYYVNSPNGQTEVVDLAPYGYSYTYNIWGNDNIGQVRVNSGTFSRFYYLKDHLGNIRVTISSSGGVDSYSDYYPFGGLMDGRVLASSSDTRYKLTGKERDVETGLDYFGARYYDSRIGIWRTVDLLVDKYPWLSPYSYCFNNPMKYYDPDGNDGKVVNNKQGTVPANSPSDFHSLQLNYLADKRDFQAKGYEDRINSFMSIWSNKENKDYAPSVARYLKDHTVNFGFVSNLTDGTVAMGGVAGFSDKSNNIIMDKSSFDDDKSGGADLTLHELVHKMLPGQGELPAYAAELAAGYISENIFLTSPWKDGIEGNKKAQSWSKYLQNTKDGVQIIDGQRDNFLKAVRSYGKSIIGGN